MMIILSLIISIAHAGWQRGELYVRDDNSKGPQLIYINSQDPPAMWYQPDEWHGIDITQVKSGDIPQDAKALFVHGLLITTHGNAPEQCSILIVFRAPGDTIPCMEASGELSNSPEVGGLRQNDSSFIPVKDGKIEFCWHKAPVRNWPDTCSYGINLNVQGYIK